MPFPIEFRCFHVLRETLLLVPKIHVPLLLLDVVWRERTNYNKSLDFHVGYLIVPNNVTSLERSMRF